MKKTLILGLPACFLFLFCSGRSPEFQVPDYKKWNKPVQQILDKPVPGHGATYRIIYANSTAFASGYKADASGNKRLYMKDGSIIIKESYETREDIGNKTPLIYIMVKDSLNPSSLKGWHYYMKRPGKEAVEVKSRLCIGCHEAANDKHPYFDGNRNEIFRDYLFVPIIK